MWRSLLVVVPLGFDVVYKHRVPLRTAAVRQVRQSATEVRGCDHRRCSDHRQVGVQPRLPELVMKG